MYVYTKFNQVEDLICRKVPEALCLLKCHRNNVVNGVLTPCVLPNVEVLYSWFARTPMVPKP